MAVEVVFPHDIIEQIFVRADVKALTQFKSVCKSWQSLISEDHFIKAHLNHSYNNYRNNQKKGHRRIAMSTDNKFLNVQWNPYTNGYNYLLGSSNGLVCIFNLHGQVLVANPLIRDVKKLPNPRFDRLYWLGCWGFGYDSSTDDYKVIAGSLSNFGWKGFQVLSLKTNVWKDVGKLNYMRVSWYKCGILCNGKLHWFMGDQNEKGVIVSFDLSEEKFEEIAQPGEFKYHPSFRLGIIEECLCICDHLQQPIWVMKNYNVRESWISLQYALENDKDVVHYLRPLSHTSFFTDDDLLMSKTCHFNCAFIFVPSLVSPHVNGKLKRKRGKKYR